MPRYILIDNASGYIWADTADLAGWGDTEQQPIDAARLIDAHVGAPGREYELFRRSPDGSTSPGYHVWRADVGGSEAVAVVQDGQDPEMIAAVERDCEYIGYVRVIEDAGDE